MQNISQFIIITMTSILLAACSHDSHDSSSSTAVTKRVVGQLGSDYSISNSALRSSPMNGSSLTSGNEIWVFTISETNLYEDSANVTLNYSSLLDEKQIFKISSDGSFDLNIADRCHDNGGVTGCPGIILALADTSSPNKKDHIKAFLSLDGEKSLVNLPYEEISSDIDMGTMTKGTNDKKGEAVGNQISDFDTSFASLSINDLQQIAHSDDYLKTVKNIYVNAGSVVSIRNKMRNNNTPLDQYVGFSNLENVGPTISVLVYDSSKFTFAQSDTNIYTFTPPSPVTMHYKDPEFNTTDVDEEFNSTKPFIVNGPNQSKGIDSSEAGIEIGSMFSQSFIYMNSIGSEGNWILKDGNGAIVGSYDLGLVNPVDAQGHLKSYAPSLKFETNAQGLVYKVAIKWYFYDGQQYIEQTNLEHLGKSLSRQTLSLDTIYGIGPGKTEVILDTPVNPSDLNSKYVHFQYGFYGTEVEIRYLF